MSWLTKGPGALAVFARQCYTAYSCTVNVGAQTWHQASVHRTKPLRLMNFSDTNPEITLVRSGNLPR